MTDNPAVGPDNDYGMGNRQGGGAANTHLTAVRLPSPLLDRLHSGMKEKKMSKEIRRLLYAALAAEGR